MALFIIAMLNPYKYIGERVDFFKGIDFNQKADWLLVYYQYNKCFLGIIYDSEILRKYSNELILRCNDKAKPTRKSGELLLYKDGRLVRQTYYYNSILFALELGELRNRFIPAKPKLITPFYYDQRTQMLDSLSKIGRSYILFPKDSIIKYYGCYKIECPVRRGEEKQINTNVPKYNQIFKEMLPQSNYTIKTEIELRGCCGGEEQGFVYVITIECDSKLIKDINFSKLKKNELYKDMRFYPYQCNFYFIDYYQW